MSRNVDTDVSDVASCAPSERSTTSTEEFEHEPFSAFKTKVNQLCESIWPRLLPGAFEVTHMEGGSYNRVIGVHVDVSLKRTSWLQYHAARLFPIFYSRSADEPKQIQEFVIRIPRYEHAWVDQEVALLLFLAATNVPAPKIEHFSLTLDNAIGSPFSVQVRVPGRSVGDVYLKLNTAQRIAFAADLGRALRALSRISTPCPGTLDPDSILHDPSAAPKILRLQCPPRNAQRRAPAEVATHSKPMSVYIFIKDQLAHQREYDLSLHRRYINPWSKFNRIIDCLNADGLFEDNDYYLTHMDFEPRNILLHSISNDTASLSGLLDWDESVFAPAFVSCRTPSWLWDFEGDDEEELDESIAHVDPRDAELLAVKQVFESAVGAKWLVYAYKTEYRLARDIVRMAITGISSSEGYEVANRIVKEWNELRPTQAVDEIVPGDED